MEDNNETNKIYSKVPAKTGFWTSFKKLLVTTNSY